MAFKLLAPDQKPVEHVIEDGPFKGVTLLARRPTVADQLAYRLSADVVSGAQARLALITGWRGAGEEPSPFQDERGGWVMFTPASFDLALKTQDDFVIDALTAAHKAASMPTDDRLGKSEPPSPQPLSGDPSQPTSAESSANGSNSGNSEGSPSP